MNEISKSKINIEELSLQEKDDLLSYTTQLIQRAHHMSFYVAQAIAEISQKGLYQLLEYESIEDFLALEMPHIGVKTGMNYVRIIERLGESKQIKDIFSQGEGVTLLAEVCKELDDESQPEDEKLKELIAQKTAQLTKEKAQLAKDLASEKARLKKSENTAKDLEASLDTLQKDTSRTIDTMSKAKGLDPEKFKSFQTKEDIRLVIYDFVKDLNRAQSYISDLDPELRDKEVTVDVNRLIGVIDESLKSVGQQRLMN
jgi:nitrogen regulatory protein PII-like uncharacterized protein